MSSNATASSNSSYATVTPLQHFQARVLQAAIYVVIAEQDVNDFLTGKQIHSYCYQLYSMPNSVVLQETINLLKQDGFSPVTLNEDAAGCWLSIQGQWQSQSAAPALSVEFVSPPEVCNNVTSTVLVTGSSFTNDCQVFLATTNGTQYLMTMNYINPQTLAVQIPAGFPPAPSASDYDVVVMNQAGAIAKLSLTGVASTITTAAFTMPAVNATVSVSVSSTHWMSAGLVLTLTSAGSMKIYSVTNTTTVVLTNTGTAGNAIAGTSIPSGTTIHSQGGAVLLTLNVYPPAPSPVVIHSIDPTYVDVGQDWSLTVNGSNFDNTCVVVFRGEAIYEGLLLYPLGTPPNNVKATQTLPPHTPPNYTKRNQITGQYIVANDSRAMSVPPYTIYAHSSWMSVQGADAILLSIPANKLPSAIYGTYEDGRDYTIVRVGVFRASDDTVIWCSSPLTITNKEIPPPILGAQPSYSAKTPIPVGVDTTFAPRFRSVRPENIPVGKNRTVELFGFHFDQFIRPKCYGVVLWNHGIKIPLSMTPNTPGAGGWTAANVSNPSWNPTPWESMNIDDWGSPVSTGIPSGSTITDPYTTQTPTITPDSSTGLYPSTTNSFVIPAIGSIVHVDVNSTVQLFIGQSIFVSASTGQTAYLQVTGIAGGTQFYAINSGGSIYCPNNPKNQLLWKYNLTNCVTSYYPGVSTFVPTIVDGVDLSSDGITAQIIFSAGITLVNPTVVSLKSFSSPVTIQVSLDLNPTDALRSMSGYTAYTTAAFTMPIKGAYTTVNITDTSWMLPGAIVYVASAGFMQLGEAIYSTYAPLSNLGYTGNAAPGTIIATQSVVSGGSYTFGSFTLPPDTNTSVSVPIMDSLWLSPYQTIAMSTFEAGAPIIYMSVGDKESLDSADGYVDMWYVGSSANSGVALGTTVIPTNTYAYGGYVQTFTVGVYNPNFAGAKHGLYYNSDPLQIKSDTSYMNLVSFTIPSTDAYRYAAGQSYSLSITTTMPDNTTTAVKQPVAFSIVP